MFDIEIVEKKGVQLIDSKLLHKKLEVGSYHADWIRRRIENYGFVEGSDFYLSQQSKMSNGKKSGGRLKKDYLISMDMAKELAMLENNDIGKATRKYFIKVEKDYRKKETIRLAGKETRKTLMNIIDESGENERMHGHGYSTFTNFVYKITGLTGEFKQFKSDKKIVDGYDKLSFRDVITPDQLKRVELAEGLIKPLLKMEKEYGEIKDIIEPLFKNKELI